MITAALVVGLLGAGGAVPSDTVEAPPVAVMGAAAGDSWAAAAQPRDAAGPLADPTRMAEAEVAPSGGDRWLAEDKVRHFGVSFAATSMAFGGARSLVDRDPALALAAGSALALGIGKELVDRRRGGPFSVKDLAWDLAGVALGVALARRMD